MGDVNARERVILHNEDCPQRQVALVDGNDVSRHLEPDSVALDLACEERL